MRQQHSTIVIGNTGFIDNPVNIYEKVQAEATVLNSLIAADKTYKIPNSISHICTIKVNKDKTTANIVLSYNHKEVNRLETSEHPDEILTLSDFHDFTESLLQYDIETPEIQAKCQYFYLKLIEAQNTTANAPKSHRSGHITDNNVKQNSVQVQQHRT